ncbi:MAG: tetratricopeptide repeat protein [bacterium]|nr:tetratricopeptide repeat protein [bacterium]
MAERPNRALHPGLSRTGLGVDFAPPRVKYANRRLAYLLALAMLALGGCDRGRAPDPESRLDAFDLLEIPHPSLAGTDTAVQEQVREHRARVEEPAAIQDAPATAEAYGDLGLVYVLYDFVQAAEVCFENARRLAPDDFRWLYLLGYAHKLGGELEEAVAFFEQSLELRPDFLSAILRLGRAYFDLGDHDSAQTWFEKSLAVEPSAAASEGLGKIAVARGDFPAAVEHFTRALEQQPNASSLRYALGQAYQRSGRTEEAKRELELSGDAPVSIPDPIISPLAVAGESAQFFLIQAGEALEDQNYEVAAAAYERALEKEPTNFGAYRSRSFALQQLGDLDGAIGSLEAGLTEGTTGDPAKDAQERAELHRVLGGFKALDRRDVDAVTHFQESLRLEPDQPDVRMKLANALARVGRFEAALPEYTSVLESHPELAPDILVRRATALVNLDRGAEALEDFERAVALRPDDLGLRSRHADALERLGYPQRAARERREVDRRTASASEDPARVRELVQMATTAVTQNRHQEALRYLSQALKEHPDSIAALFQRGTVLGHLERCDEAVADFRRVIEAERRHAGARHGEIVCLVLMSRYGHARVRLNEALRIFSLDARLAHLQARLLATAPDTGVRDGDLALAVAQRLAENVDGLRIRETLALAYAASGDLERAASLQASLIGEARVHGDEALVRDLQAKLVELAAGRAWVASSPQEILDAALK